MLTVLAAAIPFSIAAVAFPWAGSLTTLSELTMAFDLPNQGLQMYNRCQWTRIPDPTKGKFLRFCNGGRIVYSHPYINQSMIFADPMDIFRAFKSGIFNSNRNLEVLALVCFSSEEDELIYPLVMLAPTEGYTRKAPSFGTECHYSNIVDPREGEFIVSVYRYL